MMRNLWCVSIFAAAAAFAASGGALEPGDVAPAFELDSSSGERVSLDSLTRAGLSVVSFVGLDSRPSREIAVTLAGLRRDRSEGEIAVAAVARDPREALQRFAESLDLGYTLLSDPDGAVMERYGAALVLPLTYVLAPGGTVAEVVRGGGMTSQKLLLAVAEKEFARGNVVVAEALFDQVSRENPKNAAARSGKAFALARAGKLERAEEEFTALDGLGGEGERLAAEGLAEVALLAGDLGEARAQAERAGPKSVHAAVVRGRIAAREGKVDEARASFTRAAAAPEGARWQRAIALNNLARIVGSEKGADAAVDGHDAAIAAEPFLTEARSDKGAVLAEAGRPAEAKQALAEARSLAPNDQLVTTLLRRLEQRESESTDLERRKLVDRLVNDLAAAYRSGKTVAPKGDEWSPRRIVVAFVDLRDELDVTARSGIVDAFVARATERVRSSGRFDVVERETLDRLLAELKLGSSELADPATRLRLGRVLAAASMATGSFVSVGGKDRVELRFVDTETTRIAATASEAIPDAARIGAVADAVADRWLEALRAEYPLRGKIAEIADGEIVIGIGAKHGLGVGAEFDVVELGAPIEIDGEVIGRRKRKIGRLRVTAVEEGFATAEAVSGSGFTAGQLLSEASPQ